MRGDLYRNGIISKCKECRLVMNSEICTGCGKPATLHKDFNSVINLNTVILENYERLYKIGVFLDITKEGYLEKTKVFSGDFGFGVGIEDAFGFDSKDADKVQHTSSGLGSFSSMK